jgi:hypothetical protein
VKVIIYMGTQTDSFSPAHTAQDATVASSAFNRIATAEELKMCFIVFFLIVLQHQRMFVSRFECRNLSIFRLALSLEVLITFIPWTPIQTYSSVVSKASR